jgi:hypothetical protein
MDSTDLFPEELSFLKLFNGERKTEYRKSPWIKSAFDDEVWAFNFGSVGQYKVDFRVKLENGSLLTSESNRSLLELFKFWICIQTHPDISGGSIYSEQYANVLIRRVLLLIDYFLINSEHFKLSQYGLKNLTENDILNMFTQLASSNKNTTSIYQWPTRLNEYLRSELKKNDINLLIAEVKSNPILALNLPSDDDRMLNLTEQEIIYCRALLWKNGYYKKNRPKSTSLGSYRYSPNTEKLSQKIYTNTLRGGLRKPQPIELLLDPYEDYRREFNRIPVRNECEDFLDELEFGGYKSTLRSLGQLAEIGVDVPVIALNAFSNSLNQKNCNRKSNGRYYTLPHNLVLNSLRRAVEFALAYGQELLDSVLSVIRAARCSDSSCISFAATNDIRPLLHPKIRDMGVCVWSLGFHMSHIERNSIHSGKQRPSSNSYFIRLRENEGLHELLRVFYGAVQLCVGTLMARRQGELNDMICGSTLDQAKTFMLFYNRKSGVGNMKNIEARPIPPVAVHLIELLQNFHERLVEMGASNGKSQIFSYPNYHSGKPGLLSVSKYYASIEIFCDYIETPQNEKGERYYFRQHQLRRFFAMMFFWGNSFGGMETLRWFLGHTDIEHLFHYITESTPGNVLLASKAYYGGELLRENPEEAPQLADIVEKYFKTRNFMVLDSEELEAYVEDLIVEGLIEIEPIFFEGPNGKDFRIAIKTVEKI